jgi:hypothetical protein
MADLNVFKTVAKTIDNASADSIYAAPINYTGIVLSTQVANTDPDSDVSLTFTYFDSASSPGTELLKDFVIPKGDAVNATAGKLVIQTQHYLTMQASKSNSLKVVLGVLESLNG